MKIKHIFLIAIVALMTFELKTSAAPNVIPTSSQVVRQAVLTARNADSEINIRQAPDTRSAAPYYGLVNEQVQVLDETQGKDGYTWYYVKSLRTVAKGWTRGDFVRLETRQSPVAIAPESRPLPVRPNPNPANLSVNPPPTSNPIPTGRYTPEQIEYFLEVALGNEFGSQSARIKKWQGAVRIKVNGSPTATDLDTLNQVIGEVNALVDGAIRLELDQANPNVQIYFVPESQFKRYEANYRPRNLGFFWARWQQNVIRDSKILISTTGVTQKERSHLIREELTQTLGLMKDSFRYRDSIFFQGWTDSNAYTEIDKAVIRLLYRPEILPGSGKTEVLTALRNLTASIDRPTSNTSNAIGGRNSIPMETPVEFNSP